LYLITALKTPFLFSLVILKIAFPLKLVLAVYGFSLTFKVSLAFGLL